MSGDVRRSRLDTLGLALSGVCLVHCIALPLAAITIPAFTLGLDQKTDHAFHWVLLALALPISSLALWNGMKRTGEHRWIALGSAGLCLMALGVSNAFGAATEVPLTAVGVMCLAVAHVKNFRLTNRHRHDEVE